MWGHSILPKLSVGLFSPPPPPGKGTCAALSLGSYMASREYHIYSPSNSRTAECTAIICVPLQPPSPDAVQMLLWLLRHISSCSSKQITSFSALILSLSKICCLNFWSPLPLGRNQAQCDSQIFRAVSVKLQ